jgi:ketosteroid isomerase-like protein
VFYWLFDHHRSGCLLLGTALIVLGVLWCRTKDRRAATGFGTVATLLVVFLIAGFFVETPAKQVVRKLKEMAAAVQAKDLEGIFRHISDEFDWQGDTKPVFRSGAQHALDSGFISEVVVWDFQSPQVKPGKGSDKGSATVEFKVKAKGSFGETSPYLRCTATFVEDPDGQWRLKGFVVRHFNSDQPIGKSYAPP